MDDHNAGEPATNERIMLAHSKMNVEWLREPSATHFVYKQGHDERCYICTLLRRIAELEAELAL